MLKYGQRYVEKPQKLNFWESLREDIFYSFYLWYLVTYTKDETLQLG